MDGRGRSAPTCIGNIQELMAQGNIRVEVHRYRSLMFNENVSWRRLLIGQQKLCQILYKGRYIKKVAMRFNNNLAIKTHSSFLSEWRQAYHFYRWIVHPQFALFKVLDRWFQTCLQKTSLERTTAHNGTCRWKRRIY
jgi:hypothetical protein